MSNRPAKNGASADEQKTCATLRPLSLQQERFVRFYTGIGLPTFGNALQSARKAGYKGNDNTLGQTGFQLLRNPKIALAVENAKKEAAEAEGIDVDWWRKEQVKLYKKSIEADDRSQANIALKALGQHVGAFEADNGQKALRALGVIVFDPAKALPAQEKSPAQAELIEGEVVTSTDQP